MKRLGAYRGILASSALVACGFWLWCDASALGEKSSREPSKRERPSVVTENPLRGFRPVDPKALEGDHFTTELSHGRAILTLFPRLQAHLEQEFRRYHVPFGAVVAIEPETGKVLAYVSHDESTHVDRDYALDATPPAASIFKIITGAALLEAGVSASERVCYNGGLHSLTQSDIEDNPRRDRACATLGEAMGGSINAVFAKLAIRKLNRESLTTYARAFGFGRSLSLHHIDVPQSAIDIPTEPLEFARASAGFWHSQLSPFHAALIAATVANQGKMARPIMVARVIDAKGKTTWESHETAAPRQVIRPATARTLGELMEYTVTQGTARGAFFDPHGKPFIPGVRIAGKTGTLNSANPFRAYTWWVGFAPIDRPRIAVAALVVNGERWRIKASYMAREAIRSYLAK